MANLIDETYFQYGIISVPDLVNSGLQSQAADVKRARLTREITVCQDRFLNIILGEDLYTEFKAGGAKWDTFKAKLVNAELKTSPLANYVFFYYWPDHCTPNMGLGSTVSVPDSGQVLSPSVKTIPAWNQMAEMNIVLLNWLYENRANYEHDEVLLPICNWNQLVETVWYF